MPKQRQFTGQAGEITEPGQWCQAVSGTHRAIDRIEKRLAAPVLSIPIVKPPSALTLISTAWLSFVFGKVMACAAFFAA